MSGPATILPHGSRCNCPYIQRLQQVIAILTQHITNCASIMTDRPTDRPTNRHFCDCVSKGAERKPRHKHFRTFCINLQDLSRRQYSYRTEDTGGTGCWFSFTPFIVPVYLLPYRVPERVWNVRHVSSEFLQNQCLWVGSFIYAHTYINLHT